MGEIRMRLPRVPVAVVMAFVAMTIASSRPWAAVEAAATGRVFSSKSSALHLSSFSAAPSSDSDSSCFDGEGAALFVFGASHMDVGENFAAMPFRSPSDFSPYGLDFFASATGRHSNGRLIVDHISEGLGQEFLSPYLRAAGSSFQHGVSFASSGSTARNSSVRGDGSSSNGLFSLSVQVDQFRVFRQQAIAMHKSKQGGPRVFPTLNAFAKGVYIIETGNNDYYGISIDEFDALIPLVLQSIEMAIQVLYKEGARTVVIMDAFPAACFPGPLSDAHPRELNEDGCLNAIAKKTEQYNAALKAMLANLNAELMEAELVLFGMHDVFMSAIRNPSKFGLKYVHKACCGYGGGDYNYNRVVYCGRDGILNGESLKATVCENQSEYMMWDGIHPTDAFAFHIAQAFLRGENMQPAFHIKEFCKNK